MPERSVTHDTFVIERTYDASPAKVFAAFADPRIKARWFNGPEEWGPDVSEVDFRVGGRETSRGGPKGGPVHFFDARYQEIVPNERIIFAYNMYVDDLQLSVSLTTIEFRPSGEGTRLTFTEQGAYLDGIDGAAGRRQGTEDLLANLGKELARPTADA
jgi:uncharacterized protein YndB with AHSA1/START domain